MHIYYVSGKHWADPDPSERMPEAVVRAAMLAFELKGDRHKIVWPVLALHSSMVSDRNRTAARRQAATTLYHDVKARCVAASRYGDRFGWFQYRMLPDGRTLVELADAEVRSAAEALSGSVDASRQLPPADDETYEASVGEYRSGAKVRDR